MPYHHLLVHLASLVGLGSVPAERLPPDIYPKPREGDRLIPCFAPFLSQDLKPCVLPVDREMIRRHKNFDYTDAELQDWLSASVTMSLDGTGMERPFIARWSHV